MSAFPSFEKYKLLAGQFCLVPVYRRLLSDHLTPVSAFRLLDDGESPACLFESVVGGEKIGRYSFIAIHPRS
jgi:anthranilate synthase component 1